MSKRIRSIIIAAVALVLLIAAALILATLPDSSEENTSSNGNESGLTSSESTDILGYITVYEFKNEQIASIQVKNEYGGFTINQVSEDEWIVEEASDYEVNTATLDDLKTSCIQFAATKVIAENPEDLTVYGIDDNSTVASVSYTTGEKLNMYIGADASSGGRYVYIKENDKVYLTSSGWSDVFKHKYTAYINLVMTPVMDTDEDGNEVDPRVKKISYSGRGLETPVIVEENPEYTAAEKDGTLNSSTTKNYSRFIYTSPIVADISNDSYDGLQNYYFGISAYDIYELNPTAKDLADCGLADPYVTVEVTALNSTFSIKLGNTVTIGDGEYYYATATDKKAIYVVDSLDFSFFKADPIDYMSALVVNVMLDDIASIGVEMDGEKYEFTASGTEDDLVVRWNGKKMSTAEYRDLYQLIMLAYCEESVQPGQYKGEADLKITYKYRNKDKIDVIEYVKVETRKYMIRRNGGDLALCRSKYVDTLKQGINLFISGKDVPTDY